MKRSPALLALSREHHTALSLAVRIARAADAETEASLLSRVLAVFESELEPHFQEEERRLLPALLAVGETELVNRTLEEHKMLRHLVEKMKLDDHLSLKAFGEQLAAHVRFEERELFVTAQDVLSADYLNQAE